MNRSPDLEMALVQINPTIDLGKGELKHDAYAYPLLCNASPTQSIHIIVTGIHDDVLCLDPTMTLKSNGVNCQECSCFRVSIME